jgi:hypothetical protein
LLQKGSKKRMALMPDEDFEGDFLKLEDPKSGMNMTFENGSKCIINVQSRAINFGRQGHSLTQLKMLHCKTVVNVITYHHVV